MKIDISRVSYKPLTPDFIPELLEIQEETFAKATGSSDFLRRNTTETLSVCFPAPSLVLGAYYEGKMIAFGILHAAGTTSENLAKDIAKRGVKVRYVDDFEDIENILKKELTAGDLVFTMGAGNVYTVGENILK